VIQIIRILLAEQLAKISWKQADLARATGVRPTTISSLCNEQANQIRFVHLDQICAVLDCDVGKILVREAESTTREERISTLFALAHGAYIRMLQHEQAGDAVEVKYHSGVIDAYAKVAKGFFGIDTKLFWDTVAKRG